MRQVGALARAIRRGGLPEADLAALAATMEQLAVHCEVDAKAHLDGDASGRATVRATNEAQVDDDEWRVLALASPVRH